jgi:DNA repair protein RadC
MQYQSMVQNSPDYWQQQLPTWLEVKRSKKFVSPVKSNPIQGSEDVAAAFSFLRELLHEELHVLALTASNHILHATKVGMGGPGGVSCYAADFFRMPLVVGARGVIVVHNHPSGNSRPSPEDIFFTQELMKVAHVLKITLLDHVVIGEDHSSIINLIS